ncbi:hypothetical protein G1H11_13105 [Phytoactinopolyspora alkaliphila]|uniref:Uncharacterized protein n=1 Tax=Phytoactinopolyspora alkaliphila TaxID=1783498 RepID=A0A6N9YMV6_9ACTN|nr:hypothetical protein [Phytoactinopolyspora alkaliphila]NED96250.1 hypothetical protein [Phytoactinopolyspora alkaliphila]
MRAGPVIRRATIGLVGGAVANVVLAFGAPVQIASDPDAAATCARILPVAEQYGAQSVVVGERSTAGDVAAWQESRHAPDVTWVETPIRAMPAGELMTVCVFRGSFVTPTGGPGLDGRRSPQHEVMTLLVSADGEVTFDSAGYEGQSTYRVPSEWRR